MSAVEVFESDLVASESGAVPLDPLANQAARLRVTVAPFYKLAPVPVPLPAVARRAARDEVSEDMPIAREAATIHEPKEVVPRRGLSTAIDAREVAVGILAQHAHGLGDPLIVVDIHRCDG